MQRISLVAVAFVVALAPSGARADTSAPRDGLTLEVGAGLGYLDVPDQAVRRSGLYGINLGLGSFVTPDLAITIRGSGVYAFAASGTVTVASALGSFQYFVTDRLAIACGAGLMVGDGPLTATMPLHHEVGPAGNARAGYGLATLRGGTLRAVAEVNVGRLLGVSVFDGGLGIEWQLP